MDTVDLEELPDFRVSERAGAVVLWPSCEGQIDVWELFSDNSYLGAGLDWWGLLVAVPVSWPSQKAFHQNSYWLLVKAQRKETQDCCDVPNYHFQKLQTKEVIWRQYNLCLAVTEYQILCDEYFLIMGPESGKIWWLKRYNVFRRDITVNGPFYVEGNPRASSMTWTISYHHMSQYLTRNDNVVPLKLQILTLAIMTVPAMSSSPQTSSTLWTNANL